MKLAIGFFDGVHLGHRRILAEADAALTFRAHPLSVLAPDKAPPLLMTPEERLAAIAAALKGTPATFPPSHLPTFPPSHLPTFPPRVRALSFTRELAAEPADAFAARLRHDYPELATILCGPNWRFGAGGAGDADFLRAHGFAVEVVPLEELDGAPVSSTRIRAALQAGDLPLANAMLGRPFTVAGEVVPGKGEGRKLGFPTINVRPANPCLARLLPLGVYVADTDWGRAVANWGQAPTMGEQAWTSPVLEVHVVGRGEGEKVGRGEGEKVGRGEGGKVGRGEGEKVEISLRRFLRPERRFDSVEALREQIKTDVFSASHSPQDRL